MAYRHTPSNRNKIRFSERDIYNLIKIILPNFPASIYAKDTEGRYVWCNKYQLNMAGVTKLSEVQGKTDYELPWREKADRITSIDKQVLRSREAIVTEERAILNSGKEAIFLTRKVPWFMNEGDSQPAGIMGVSVEVTEYRKVTEDIQAYLNNVVSNIPGSVYWKNLKLEYLGCNNFVLKMAGLKSKSQIIGKTDYDLVWHKQANAIVKNDREVIETGLTQSFEETPKLATGQRITMMTYKTPLRDLNGNVIGVLGISMDISDRKAMEEELKEAKAKAEEFNQLKSQFISNMQHDLRSPTSGVIQARL
jgi:two-component system aerobic respiration control sensor histidine kinase ArcB